MESNLNIKWKQLTQNYCSKPPLIQQLWTEINLAYSHHTRHYHNFQHLHFMIQQIDLLQEQILDLDSLLFSVFYHDIIYHIRKKDNEEQSALLAEKRLKELGLPPEKIEKCKAQILATKAHQKSTDRDTNLLVDIDLLILAEPLEKYEIYTQQIRKEYAYYPDFLYKHGRKKVLRHFLEMPQIFKSPPFQNHHEQWARQNLQNELNSLTS